MTTPKVHPYAMNCGIIFKSDSPSFKFKSVVLYCSTSEIAPLFVSITDLGLPVVPLVRTIAATQLSPFLLISALAFLPSIKNLFQVQYLSFHFSVNDGIPFAFSFFLNTALKGICFIKGIESP